MFWLNLIFYLCLVLCHQTKRNMKAIRIHEFGQPEVMKLEEVERPIPAPNEILVKVYASAVNPIDLKIRDGSVISRLHVRLHLPIVLGWDASGIIEEVGSEVTGFKQGDEVFGIPNFPGDGSYAEYVAADAQKFALKPKSITFNQAAAVPVSAITAWDGIIRGGQVQPGERVLIHGAAGNVGHFAVQFAKWKGAYVIGTAKAADFDFLKKLGADEVIDYQNQKFEELLKDIDVVFDAAVPGSEMQLKSIKIMNKNGRLSTTQGYPLIEDVTKALAGKNARGHVIYGENKIHGWLTEISRLFDENKLKVAINKIYPLVQVSDAHREAQIKRRPGKLVLEVTKEQ